MDWTTIVPTIVTVLGTGGVGGFFLAYHKNNKEAERAEKLNEARIKESEANTNLKIQEANAKFVEQIQEANDKANARIDELTRQVAAQGNRIILLEATLIKHDIPLPA